ncbi:MAG: proline dehydrogenase family protein [Planctomycetes bacterium]|nr:proline dehydrogenase family protein [Planctomycetota bacterium]
MSLFDRVVRLGLPLVPRRMVWILARRYVAGETLESALDEIREQGARGFGTILDVLGEAVKSKERAEGAAAEYHRALAALAQSPSRTYVSVKPTHLGLTFDPALCGRLLDDLCVRAAEQGRKVRFEMEDAPTVDRTLEVFLRVRAKRENLGCVLQARLFRTPDDVTRLLRELGGGLDVRLVKGIYLEPAEIAHTEAPDISRAYVDLARQLVAGGAFAAFATHDDDVAAACAQIARDAGLGDGRDPDAARYEYQMLMGVKAPMAERLLAEGHPVRIYVPYGKDWHAYSIRRLRKNPEVARHIARAFFSRGG